MTSKYLLIPFFLFVSISFGQSNNEPKEFIEIKNEIKRHFIQTGNYADSIVSNREFRKNASKKEIYFIRQIQLIETKIHNEIKLCNKLILENKINEDQLLDFFESKIFDSIALKVKKVDSLGINVSKIPITNYYSLEQEHIDTIAKFSISYPKDWELITDFQNFTLMGAGPYFDVPIGEMTRDGVFGIDIKPISSSFNSDSYFQGNIASMEKNSENFRLVDLRKINIDGINANYTIFKTTRNGLSNTHLQVYFVKNGFSYIMSGTSFTRNIDIYFNLYIEIIRSFNFID